MLVVTITAAEPPEHLVSETAQSLHRRWAESVAAAGERGTNPAAAIVAQRRAEDRAALALLRADYLHLPYLDCVYRCGPDSDQPLYPGPVDMFGPPNPDDAALIAALVGAFLALPSAGRVYAPLGVGGHVDHLAVRRAAAQVFPALCFYEDYPYTARPGALDAVLAAVTHAERTAETVWLGKDDLATKVAAVAAYTSQLSTFFAGPEDMAAQLRADGRRVMADARADGEIPPGWAAGGERLHGFTVNSFEESADAPL